MFQFDSLGHYALELNLNNLFKVQMKMKCMKFPSRLYSEKIRIPSKLCSMALWSFGSILSFCNIIQ